jgi:hypothetical protein
METAASFEVRNAPSSYPTICDIRVARQQPVFMLCLLDFLKAIYRFTRPSTRRDLGADREDSVVTKLAAALSILAVGGGLARRLPGRLPRRTRG